ncbi:MAG: hypothetical protein F6K00_33635 [Leptolyngbya sp. SIOISBB]|nr:hypothetical protein [Leptolyngbya sp. SIOISBB]
MCAKIHLRLSLVALGLSLAACGAGVVDESPENVAQSPESAASEIATPSEPATITADTAVDVVWQHCDVGLFREPTEWDSYPVDEQGCRVNDVRITVWPLEDGTVEVVFVRGRLSPSMLDRGEDETYQVATRSRGCDPNGPQAEGLYRVGELVSIKVDAAADRKFIPAEQVSLTAIEAPEEDSEVIQGFLFLRGDCDEIDPDRVF